MSRNNECNNLIQSKELKEFIEANKNITPDEIAEMFKNRTRQQREKIVVNRQADLKILEAVETEKKFLETHNIKQSEVAKNRFKASIDTSDVGLLRNLIMNASGVWYAGAGNNLELKQYAYTSKYKNKLLAELDKLDVRVVNNKDLNKGRYDYSTPEGQLFHQQIMLEWGILNGAKDNPTGNSKAKEVAKALNEVTQSAIKDQQILGLKTGLKEGYAGRQTHNANKISLAEETYWDFTLPLLKEEQRLLFEKDRNITGKIYNTLSGKDTGNFSIENLPLKARESIENFNNTRSFEFKDTTSQIEYHKKFGDTADIIDITLGSLEVQGRKMAQFEMFGFQTPEVAIEKAVNRIWDNMPQTQKEKLVNEGFSLSKIKQRLNADIEEVAHGSRLPEGTQKLLQYQGARVLTGTVLNMMSVDKVVKGSQKFLRTGDLSGAGKETLTGIATAPFSAFNTIFKSWTKGNRAGLTKEEFYKMGQLGYLAEGHVRNAHDFIAKNGIFEVKKANKFDTYINWIHRLAGNTADNQSKQIMIKNSLTKEFRDFANGDFKGDTAVYQDFLKIYFSEGEINAMKTIKESRTGDGIHAGDMRYLENNKIKPLIETELNNLKIQFEAEKINNPKLDNILLDEKTNNLYEKKKLELETKYNQMLNAEVMRNLNIGGARAKSFARGDGKTLTSTGAIFMQLKTSSISQYFDLYQRTLTHPHFSKMGKIGVMGGEIAFLTLAGMVTVMLSDATNNWGEPKKRDLNTLVLEGFQRGTAGGMLYDASKSLLGRELGGVFFDQRVADKGKVSDILSFVAGPTGGQVADILTSAGDLLNKESGKFKPKVDKAIDTAIKSTIPATNLFYIRAITNYSLEGLGLVLQDISGNTLKTTKREARLKRSRAEEGLFSEQSPRKTLLN
jgi:hypothetical protein